MTDQTMRKPNRLRWLIWGGAAALLLTPAIAMQFNKEVQWDAFDFLIAGAVLGGAGLAYELAAWMSGDLKYRLGFGLGVISCVLVVWINGAVGMIGDGGQNLVFLAVPLVALAGTAIARMKAGGMVWAAVAAGATQLAATGAAVALAPAWEVRDILLACAFALPWLLAAGLMRSAR